MLIMTTIDKIQNNFNTPKNTFQLPLSIQTLPSLQTPGNHSSVFCSCIFDFPKCHRNGIIEYEFETHTHSRLSFSLNIIQKVFFFFTIFERMFIFAEHKIRKEDKKDSVTAELTWITSWHSKRNGEVIKILPKHCFPSYISRASSI